MGQKAKEEIVEIYSGLYQIKLPVPIRSLGYVFSYLAVDGKDNLLIDTGWPSSEALEVLESALSYLGTSLSDIKTVVISHLHPDHFGLAEEIKDASPDSKLIIHQADASLIMDNYEEYKAFIKELHEWLWEQGTPDIELKSMLDASSSLLQFFRPPKPTNIVNGGEIIRVGDKWQFEVISTPGHTIGTICLYDHGNSKVLFSGDHILPTITPNVSLGPYYKGDPLGDYLRSLDRVSRLDTTKVLPSHEHIFSNLRERVGEIKKHHEERLADAKSVLQKLPNAQVMSGYEVASKLHWYSGPWETIGAWERRAAIMETLAHLEYLKRQGKIIEVDELVDGKPRVSFAFVGKTC